MAKPVFSIDSVSFSKDSDYNTPGIYYQISSEDDDVIRGFIACKNVAEGRTELEFQLNEFNYRLENPGGQWETRSVTPNSIVNHRANRTQRRRLKHAANS